MEQEKLNGILHAHKKWLDSNGKEGVRANLCDANLCDDDLRNADLRNANLCGADLRCADLRYADLCDADMRYVNMDYAVLPLSCGGLYMHVDDRIGIQMLYHAVENILHSKNTSAELKKAVSHPDIIAQVNKFHHVDECGKVEPYCEVIPK